MNKISDILLDYLSVSDICSNYNISRHAVEYLIRTRDKNGLDKIIEKIGRKFYIRKDCFEKWARNYYGEN
jgi:predicted DNA-binding protein YlxM (UPF0122 family)